jgi:hypothetical protein
MAEGGPIPAQMFVSDDQNSPRCLAGHPTVVCEPPWELVGQFLTGEMDSSRGWLFRNLPRFLRECAGGRRVEYVGGTEGFDLEARAGVVRLNMVYTLPPTNCEIPLGLFRDLLDRWRAFVRASERAEKGDIQN